MAATLHPPWAMVVSRWRRVLPLVGILGGSSAGAGVSAASEGVSASPLRLLSTLRVTPPLAGKQAVRSGATPPGATGNPASDDALLFVTLSQTFIRGPGTIPLTIEGELGIIGVRPRVRAGLLGGPSLAVVDTRRPSGRGSVVLLQPHVGVVYRGKQYEWVHNGGLVGREAAGPIMQLGIEGVHFISASFGWTARARAGAEWYAVRRGDPRWFGDSSTGHDDARAAAGIFLDLGMTWW